MQGIGEMLEAIRTYFFEREKRKRLSQSSRKAGRYKRDHKIHFGILADASDGQHRLEVLEFADRLRKEGHQVKILGYLEGKPTGLTIPFDHFSAVDLARVSQVPRSPMVEAFIDQPFDVLINTSIAHNYKPIEYISTLSKAAFRIGPWYEHARQNPYDLCLDTGRTSTLQEWINELMHTLQKIY